MSFRPFRWCSTRPTALAAVVVLGLATPARAGDVRTLPKGSFSSAKGALLAAIGSTKQADLRQERPRSLGTDSRVTLFSQWHLGYRVFGRGASLRENVSTGEALVHSSLADHFSSGVGAPISSDLARASARVSAKSSARMVWWSPIQGLDYRLTWEVLSPLSFEGGAPVSYRTFVDAQTGEVRARENRARTFDQVNVFPLNPVVTKNPTPLALPIASQNGALSTEFLRAFNCIDNKAVRPVSFGQITVDLHVCDVAPTATADANGDFSFTPVDDPNLPETRRDTFAETSIFYHAARAYSFFRDLDGNPAAQVVTAKPFSAIANLQIPAGISDGDFSKASDPNTPLDPYSNAFFSPGGEGDPFAAVANVDGGAIWFGQGPLRDYAYDGDVVYHEFTHAVVDHTLSLGNLTIDNQGVSMAPGAMNEGLADYFSSALAGDPEVGEYASRDLSQNSGAIRTLANTDACPSAVFGEVHRDSTLFSGALWSTRTSLPEGSRRDFDRSLYRSMVANASSFDIGYDELATLFVQGLKLDMPTVAPVLEAEMKKRGVLPACKREVAYLGKPIGDSHDFYAVGRSMVNIPLVPGVMSFTRTLSDKPSRKLKVNYAGRNLGTNGQGGTPFKPVVLVKYDGAISWKFSAKAGTPNADAQQEGDAEGGSLTFDLPDEITSVSVQFANSGTAQGVYGEVELLEVLPTPPKTPATGVDAGTSKGSGATPADGATLGGGGCSTPSPGAPRSGVALTSMMLALCTFVRRRLRTR